MSKQGKLISFVIVITMMLTNIIGIVAARDYEAVKDYKTEAFVLDNQQIDLVSRPDGNICTNAQNIAPASEEDIRYFERLALQSDEFQSFKRQLSTNYHGEFRLQLRERYSLTVEENIIAVYIPITGGAGNSFYGVWFDTETDTVFRTISGVFAFDSDQNVVVRFEYNSSPLLDAVISQEGVVLSGTAYDIEGNEVDISEFIGVSLPNTTNASAGWAWWDCMTGCLSNFGVPLFLIGGLSIICSAVCFGTAGLLCGACIAVALGAWSGAGAACIFICS